jgi:hypothetical protein
VRKHARVVQQLVAGDGWFTDVPQVDEEEFKRPPLVGCEQLTKHLPLCIG